MPTIPSVPNANEKSWRAVLIGSPLGWGISLLAAALGTYLLLTHTGHVLSAVPYVVLLACPLMHIFMHRAHGRHHDNDR